MCSGLTGTHEAFVYSSLVYTVGSGCFSLLLPISFQSVQVFKLLTLWWKNRESIPFQSWSVERTCLLFLWLFFRTVHNTQCLLAVYLLKEDIILCLSDFLNTAPLFNSFGIHSFLSRLALRKHDFSQLLDMNNVKAKSTKLPPPARLQVVRLSACNISSRIRFAELEESGGTAFCT